MSEDLRLYYTRELQFIRQLAREFAKQYPVQAGRMFLEDNLSLDPHVERLIESFALIAGRIQHKLDDEFPELTDALLQVLYPHYLAPIPSMAIVQFELDPNIIKLPDGFVIPRHSTLKTAPVEGLPCLFRTGYRTELWPVRLNEARLMPPPFPSGYQPPPRTAAALRLELECSGDLPLAELSLDRLRFFLNGENAAVALLYEILFNHVRQIVLRPLGPDAQRLPPVLLDPPGDFVLPVGFELDEALLPYTRRSFPGYRLLSEFFAFRSKFLFFDLRGLSAAKRAGYDRRFEVVFFLDRSQGSLESAVDASTFRMGCTPIVNLFEKLTEPIDLSYSRWEYKITPDVAYPQGMEVYSVEEVISGDSTTGESVQYQPFYSYRHGQSQETRRAFWYAARRAATAPGDRATDVYLTLVNLDFNPHSPSDPRLVVRTTCTNRDLPMVLQQAGEDLYLELEQAAPLTGNGVRCLRTPSTPLRPPLRRGAAWRLLSHLSLNHLSLTDEAEGLAALQEMLRLYDFSDPEASGQQATVTRNLIEGLTRLSSRPVVGRTGGPTSSGFCRGVEITLEFDEQKYLGSGWFLFAAVLERFLGLYVSINSFTQLAVTTQQRQGVLKVWPPRAGEQPLL
jgi:type VI secretion system protein ImpG